jgi:hypothetical protein
MKKNTTSLEEQYVNSAIGHHELLMAGNLAGSNRVHKRLHDVTRKLRAKSDRGLSALIVLLDHQHPSVRLWAAAHLLPLDENRALKALQEISSNSKLYPWQLKTSAKTTIEEWKAGRLDADWFMKKS